MVELGPGDAEGALVIFADPVEEFWDGVAAGGKDAGAKGLGHRWAEELDRLWPAIESVAERLEADGYDITTVRAALSAARTAVSEPSPVRQLARMLDNLNTRLAAHMQMTTQEVDENAPAKACGLMMAATPVRPHVRGRCSQRRSRSCFFFVSNSS